MGPVSCPDTSCIFIFIRPLIVIITVIIIVYI
jgi:hypothetical protein